MQKTISYDEIRALFKSHGFPFSEKAINIFGKRHRELVPDAFDDTLGIVLPDRTVLAYSGTTDPGRSWLLSEEGSADGCFILQPGFYENCWHRHLHHGKYKCLGQFGDNVFKGWRDNDKDGKLDLTGKTYTDVKGLNFHTTRWDVQVQRVGAFSAGCQVMEVAKEYDIVMIENIYKSIQSLFSYALFQD
jgi:hypothetical protein